MVVVRVLISGGSKPSTTTPEQVENHLAEHVHGESVPFSDDEIAKLTDWPKLRKYHKLNGMAYVEGIKDEDAKTKELEVLVVSAIALRGL